MKVALVHDYLGEFGGAERVLLALSDMYPEAPIYTAFWRKGPAWERFKDRDIRVSWAHSIPGFATKLHGPLRFLAPLIWRSFDFHEYDVVISSASWYITKGFEKKGPSASSGRPKTVEICYCHTPPRWLYGYQTSKQSPLAKAYGTIVGFFMRQYDFQAAQRVDCFIANSNETKRRIEKFYRRDATVIYPPIEISKGETLRAQGLTLKRDYYLVVSRLAQPKNVELAIRAANEMKLSLKIVGTGPDEARLKALAGPTVDFLGFVPDDELPKFYAGAKAFLALSADEDFGMTPLEAQVYGTPVIAYRGGGYRESVLDGKTGVFFDSLTVSSLVQAVRRFEKKRFSKHACQNNAERFSAVRFKREIQTFVDRSVSMIG